MTETRRTRASDMQTMFWLQQMRRPEGRTANIPALVSVTGPFDEERLRAAVTRVMQRHEVFRTSFAWDGAELRQIVHARVEAPLFRADPVTAADLDERIAALNMHRFEHHDVPLFRVTVVPSGPETRLIHALMHHSIYDLHTQSLFQSEVSRAYRDGDLDPVPVQYADFADAELAWKRSPEATRQREYWRAYTAAIPAISPADLAPVPARALSDDEPPGSSFLDLDATLVERLRALCAERGWAPFLVLGAAYQIALADRYHLDDFGVGVPFTNRRNRSLESVAGCCMNILPIRATIAPTDSLEDVVPRFRREMLLGHRNQELSLLEVLTLAGRPVYRFGFTSDAPLELELDGCACHPVDCVRPGPLALFYHVYEMPAPEVLRIRADYDGVQLCRAQAEAFNARYSSLLDRVLGHPRTSFTGLGIGT